MENDNPFRNFVIWWNYQYPVDYWWRKKYNIPIGSKKHLDQCIIDMKMEWEEDMLYKELKKINEKNDDDIENSWLKNTPDVKLSQKQVDDLFDTIDLNDLEGSGITLE